VLVFIRLLGFLRASEEIGAILSMIKKIIFDMIPFLVVLVAIVVGGGLGLPLMYAPYIDKSGYNVDILPYSNTLRSIKLMYVPDEKRGDEESGTETYEQTPRQKHHAGVMILCDVFRI